VIHSLRGLPARGPTRGGAASGWLAVGDGVPGGVSVEVAGAGGTVIPHGKGSLEVGQADDGAAV
jgi:hypothetical protein